MKMVCIDNRDAEDVYTVGKTYDSRSFGINDTLFIQILNNDNGEPSVHYQNRFITEKEYYNLQFNNKIEKLIE